MQQFTLPAAIARRLPDPVLDKEWGITRHILYVPVRAVPQGIPLDPNARTPNLRKRMYRQVEDSLLDRGENWPGTFHLKHKGITMIAHAVESAGGDTYTVTIKDGQGIVDGGHSYQLILNHSHDEELPQDQVVKFEILCGIPTDWIADIAGGLNTSIQVQPKSLDNLAGKFDWLKTELSDEPYFDQIAWRENDDGVYDVVYLLSLITCFNIFAYPNDGEAQPVVAYEKKSEVLKQFERNPEQYQRLCPIVKEIFQLHDRIGFESKDIYNNATRGKFGRWSFVEMKKPGPYVFTGLPSEHQLMTGALFPLLGAMRWTVVEDLTTGSARWQDGFESALELWRDVAPELLIQTGQASQELGRNPHSLGRSRNHWSSVHSKVGLRYLQKKTAAVAD
jgi:AIPR protein